MVTWTEEDLRNYERKRIHHVSHTQHAAPKLEPVNGNEPLAEKRLQEKDSSPVLVRIISVRKRLIDEDNLSEKWCVDCLRYIGAISGDEPEKVHIITTQRKCLKDEEECTLIEIIP